MLCCDGDYSVILPNLIIYGEEMNFVFITELASDTLCEPAHSGAVLGFLDKGFKFIKGGGGGFDLLTVPDFFINFS